MPDGAGGVAIEMLARQQSDNGTERQHKPKGPLRIASDGLLAREKTVVQFGLAESDSIIHIFTDGVNCCQLAFDQNMIIFSI